METLIFDILTFIDTSLKISHNVHGIHHHLVNLLKFYVCSVILFWHHARFATGRWITI